MESWGELVDYLLPRPDEIVPDMTPSSTKTPPYSAKDKPDPQHSPQAVILDHPGPTSILSRAKDGLRNGLAQLPTTSKPPNLEKYIDGMQEALESIRRESDVKFTWFQLEIIATALVGSIFVDSSLAIKFRLKSPAPKYSQQGDASFEVQNPPKNNSGPIISIDFKTPAVLRRRWHSPPAFLRLDATLPAEGEEAIFIKVNRSTHLSPLTLL